MNATVYCRMGYGGQEAYRLTLPWSGAAPAAEEIEISGFDREAQGRFLKKKRGTGYGEVTGVSLADGVLTIDCTIFCCRHAFTVKIGDVELHETDFEKNIEGLDKFESYVQGDVVYRLYRPKSTEKRPLLLYLHGGGNGGSRDESGDHRDNTTQLTADFGPINLAYRFPDIYILAPQAIENWTPFKQPGGKMFKQSFEDKLRQDSGWYREYLGEVCDIIRSMIREGLVDADRVYVTGLSMGGAGTLSAMSVGSDLFAACVPVCPTMMRETYDILRTIEVPVWVASAYVDHTVYRHKYLVDAIMQQKDRGHKNAHLTLYSPEELEAYDIAIRDDLTYTERFSENHMSWVPTYNDEYGIMSWLLNQHK